MSEHFQPLSHLSEVGHLRKLRAQLLENLGLMRLAHNHFRLSTTPTTRGALPTAARRVLAIPCGQVAYGEIWFNFKEDVV